MPNHYDFSNLDYINTVKINPEGWISPIIIEYGKAYHGEVISYFWRVKETQHTFIIPVLRIDYLSDGDYIKHFTEALEGFREDYKGWAEEGFYAKWMQEYRYEYSKFIKL